MNALHTMLQASFYQSAPFLGSTVTVGSIEGIQMNISQVDDRIRMELEGYMDNADYVGVCSTADFPSPPVQNTKVTGPDNETYEIKGIKTDQSAYVLALRKIS